MFLACSAFHFGATDTARRGSRMATVAIALRGTTPIALPATFHPEAYAQVLAWVLDDAGTAATWSRTLGIVGGLAGSLLAGLALTPLRAEADLDRFAARVELLAIGVAAAALPPIAFFVLYFCCWHAFRHALQFCERIDPEAPTRALGTIARRGAGNTLLCLTAVAIGAWMWSALDGVTEALVRVVFLGLAALTVPHLLLTAQPRQKVDRTSQRVVRTPLPSG